MPKLGDAIVSVPTVAWIAIASSLTVLLVLKNLLIRPRVCLLIDVVVFIGCGFSLVVFFATLVLPMGGGIIKTIK